ncbi:hypothetical protein F5148DRAFT_847034 [Russula earlei]|uniref:Uncharacterized protein n=1 Tax=Russula earlei TaxID=71964 RepID=A0ACC0TT23_9AGAM|nr:hypothetical protein F5148DRAFT_847034 [Russula earlei]
MSQPMYDTNRTQRHSNKLFLSQPQHSHGFLHITLLRHLYRGRARSSALYPHRCRWRRRRQRQLRRRLEAIPRQNGHSGPSSPHDSSFASMTSFAFVFCVVPPPLSRAEGMDRNLFFFFRASADNYPPHHSLWACSTFHFIEANLVLSPSADVLTYLPLR